MLIEGEKVPNARREWLSAAPGTTPRSPTPSEPVITKGPTAMPTDANTMTPILVALILAVILTAAFAYPKQTSSITQFLTTLTTLTLLVLTLALLGATIGAAAATVIALAGVALRILRILTTKQQP